MIHSGNSRWVFILGVMTVWLLAGCLISGAEIDYLDGETKHEIKLSIKDTYQGVKDGNTESVPLPDDSAYITVEVCIENLSEKVQFVYLQDVYITTEGHQQIFPVALGYDQAEAFSWMLPIIEPIGGKRITHKYYFFLIQDNEIMNIPAYQSLGCRKSSQFKSLALLFLVDKDITNQFFTLHFFEGEFRFLAGETSLVSDDVKYGIGMGFILILIIVIVLVVKKRKSVLKLHRDEFKGEL